MSSVYKQITKSLLAEKALISALFFLSCLGSFMYFFVQVSIDGNLRHLTYKKTNGLSLNSTEKEFLIALHSNQILASTFLIILSCITAFAFYMFFKRYYRQHINEIGCYKAYGYSNKTIIAVVFYVNSSLSFIAFLIGFLLGWFGSDVLLQLYRSSFETDSLHKGIFLSNFGLCFLFIVLLSGIISIIPYCSFLKHDVSSLLNSLPEKHQTKLLIYLSNKLSQVVPTNYRSSFRLALRKPFSILFILLAVGFFTVLWMISISLNLSSPYIYETQTLGRSYFYNIQLKDYQRYYPSTNDTMFYLSSPISISWNGNMIDQQAIGFHQQNSLFQLYSLDKKKLFLPKDNEIFINQALAELYEIKHDDVIEIAVNNSSYRVKVAAIVKNADFNTIYLSENNLASMLSLPAPIYNGMLTNTIPVNYKDGLITSENDRLTLLQKNNVSNKISAVINQLLGCIVGCLLLYLAILLNFQDYTKKILILDMLGYTATSINKILISIYRPLMNLAFIITVPVSMTVCKLIQKNISIATGDYIPFQTNFLIIIGIWILLNILYQLIHLRFNRKISIIQHSDQTKKYIL